MPIVESFVASRYTGSYNGADVGITEDGFELTSSSSQELINMSDAYGDSVIDGVYRGGNHFLDFTCLSYTKGIPPYWPWAAFGAMGLVGRMASDNARPMSISSVLAGANVPLSLSTTYSLLRENLDRRLIFSSKLRKVPIGLRLLPYILNGAPAWFVLV